MFVYERVIRIQDTDATGVLYFANQLQIGLEAFEEFLLQKRFSLEEMIRQGKFLLPVVHAEADFSAPLFIGDSIEVTLTFDLGNTSFTHASDIIKKGKKVGSTSIVHVAVCSQTQAAIPIPDLLKEKIISCS